MMEEQIWRKIAGMETPGFFITAEIHRKGEVFPAGIEEFIDRKLKLIQEGIGSRRFVFQEGESGVFISPFSLRQRWWMNGMP